MCVLTILQLVIRTAILQFTQDFEAFIHELLHHQLHITKANSESAVFATHVIGQKAGRTVRATDRSPWGPSYP
jgi:hypothetical protein